MYMKNKTKMNVAKSNRNAKKGANITKMEHKMMKYNIGNIIHIYMCVNKGYGSCYMKNDNPMS